MYFQYISHITCKQGVHNLLNDSNRQTLTKHRLLVSEELWRPHKIQLQQCYKLLDQTIPTNSNIYSPKTLTIESPIFSGKNHPLRPRTYKQPTHLPKRTKAHRHTKPDNVVRKPHYLMRVEPPINHPSLTTKMRLTAKVNNSPRYLPIIGKHHSTYTWSRPIRDCHTWSKAASMLSSSVIMKSVGWHINSAQHTLPTIPS